MSEIYDEIMHEAKKICDQLGAKDFDEAIKKLKQRGEIKK